MKEMYREQILPGSLMPGRLKRGKDYLEEYGWAFDDLQKDVRKVFETTVIAAYRNAIQESVLKAAGDLTGLGLKIVVSRWTLGRWTKEETTPEWENLFLGVASFDVDLNGRLLRGQEAVIQAVIAGVESVSRQLPNKPDTEFDREKYECLHHASIHPNWIAAQLSNNDKMKRATAQEIIARISPSVRSGTIQGVKEIEDIWDMWQEPFLLFHAVIPYEWEYRR